MKPEEYDSWYDSDRGRWIGETEYRLIIQQLKYQPGERILDVGCGTGWFTRRIARLPQSEVTGIDKDRSSLAFTWVGILKEGMSANIPGPCEQE